MIETFVERRLRETRHEFRNEIAALAAILTSGQLKQTEERSEFRGELREMRKDLAGLREDLVPMREKVSALERHDDVDEAREQERDKVFKAIEDQRRWMASTKRWGVGVGLTALGLLCGVLFFLVSHPH